MRRAGVIVVWAGLCLGACTQFPELDTQVDPSVYDRDFPKLKPIEPLLVSPERRVSPAIEQEVLGRAKGLRTRAAQTAGPSIGGSVPSRVDALRARAARLSGPVVDAATRQRMARGVPR